MSGIVQLPIPIAVNTGVIPNIKTMCTLDNYATITAAGYLNQYNLQGYPVSTTDIIQCIYAFNQVTQVGTYGTFEVSIANGVITLSEYTSTSGVNWLNLPSIAGTIPVCGDTTGDITDLQHAGAGGTATLAGNLFLGSGTTSGKLISYSGSAGTGSFQFVGASNSGNSTVTLTNGSHGQSTAWTMRDPGAAATNMVNATAALVAGNVVKASTTTGVIADAGYFLKANVTATYGGGGTSNTFTATGLTSASIVTASITTSTNAVSITKVVPGTNQLTITFSADPGASTTVYYISTSAAV